MNDIDEGINRLILTGEVISEPSRRNTPAGIAVSRFTLQHQSLQHEAGNLRKVECRIVVTAFGDVIKHALSKGAQIQVEGFLSYESRQKMETRLILHAQSIKYLKNTD